MNKQNEIKDVQPIRSLEKIEDMKWSLKKWCSERDYILFLLGINSGLRVGDMLKLKKHQLKGKKKVIIQEGKTQKKREIHISARVYTELNAYIATLEGTDWLFPSRKGDQPISRVQAYRQLNKAAEMVDITEGIGTHTLRKTFGYWYYKQHKDIAKLLTIFNHSSQDITLRYIGITHEEIEDSLTHFSL